MLGEQLGFQFVRAGEPLAAFCLGRSSLVLMGQLGEGLAGRSPKHAHWSQSAQHAPAGRSARPPPVHPSSKSARHHQLETAHHTSQSSLAKVAG